MVNIIHQKSENTSNVNCQIYKISRLQICTWNLLHGNTFFELGIEIAPGIIPEGQNCTIDFIAPWLMNTSKIISMHERFADNSNCRFIFNETVKSSSPIAGDNRNGTQIVFTTNTRIITILPVVHNILNNRVLQLSFVNKAPKDSSPYIRVLIEIKQKTLATIKKGIAKCNYIFDFKINERRNLPDFVLDTINADGLIYCDTIIVYSSFPVQRVIGEFSVEAIFSDSPKAIWEKTHSMAGITKKYFFSYFEKHNKAVAIKIGCAKRYRTAKSLSDFSLSNAPQSFVYIEE